MSVGVTARGLGPAPPLPKTACINEVPQHAQQNEGLHLKRELQREIVNDRQVKRSVGAGIGAQAESLPLISACTRIREATVVVALHAHALERPAWGGHCGCDTACKRLGKASKEWPLWL
eukprot:412630-Pelagomonas_calceolata.AAC.1